MSTCICLSGSSTHDPNAISVIAWTVSLFNKYFCLSTSLAIFVIKSVYYFSLGYTIEVLSSSGRSHLGV